MARSKKTELHETQKALLEVLNQTIDDPLTVRELQERLGLSAPNLVYHHITQLEKKGYLRRNPGNPKDYQILRDPIQRSVAYINRYGMAQCGPSNSILDGNPIERIPLPTKLIGFPAELAFIVQARGSSMLPRISNGDLILAQRGESYEDNELVVCVNNGSPLIKVFRVLESGGRILESLNPDRAQFPPIEVGADFKIEGRVKMVMSSL